MNTSPRIAALLLAPALVAAPLSPTEVDAAIERVGAIEEVVRAARDELPRADLDLEERALALAMDADQVIAWVREEVRFDAYPGVLRGPRGTLRARAGNAWDQALLTAALLRTSGFQARLARAPLEPAQAKALLGGLSPEAPQWIDPEEGAAEELGGELGALSQQDQDARDRAASAYRAQLEKETRALDVASESHRGAVREALATSEFAFQDPRASWVEEARDYAWVQYRRAQGDPWKDVHPAFPAAPTDLEPRSWVEGAVPKEALFRLQVSLMLEVAEKGRLRTERLMNDWERPVANLEGTAIQLTLSGDGFRVASDSADPEAGWARTRYFYPMWGKDLAPRARAFDLRGFAISPEAAGSAMARIFSTTGDRTLGALDTLSAATGVEGPGARELTAVWVDLKVTRPGGTSQVHRRYLLDRVGAAARSTGKATRVTAMEPEAMKAALHRQMELVVLTGDQTPYAALDEAVAYRADTLADLPATLRHLSEAAPTRTIPQSLANRRDPRGLVQATSVGTARQEPGSRTFRSGPGVFLFQRTLAPSGGVREQLDVVRSPRRGVRATREGWAPAPDAALAAGVLETVAEAHRRRPAKSVPITSAAAELADATLRLVRDVGALDDLDLPEAPRAHLVAELERGFVVLLKPGPEPAWWRVDPASGETTGVTADGAGSESVEYLDLLSVGVNLGFTAYGAAGCETSCCVATTILMGTGLTIGGLAIGADLAGRAAVAFFVIMDIGVNTATTLAIPSPCND